MGNAVALGDWITIPAAAEILGCGPKAVRALVREGRLTFRHVPTSHPRVLRTEVEAFAVACTSEANSPAA